MSKPSASILYLPVREVTTWTTKWTIRGRVIDISQVNQYKKDNGQSAKVANATIMDSAGDSIRVVFWAEAVDKHFSSLKEGNIYTFANGRVQVANRRFSTCSHMYELVFDVDANIHESKDEKLQNDDVIPLHRKSNFMKLRDIKNSSKVLPFLTDVCVAVVSMAANNDTFTRPDGTAIARRNLVVCDDTIHSMHLTLWGEAATNKKLIAAYENRRDEPVVMVVQNLHIREYKGRAGSTLRFSNLLVNPNSSEEPAAADLAKWYSTEGIHLSEEAFCSLSEGQFSSSQDSNTGGTGGAPLDHCSLKTAFEKLNRLTVSNEQDSGEFVIVVASAMRLLYSKRDGTMALSFLACTRCNKKCNTEGGEPYTCDTCNESVTKTSNRFYFTVSLVDSSASRLLVRCFNEAGEVILGRTADEMKRLIPDDVSMSEISNEAKSLLEYDALWRPYSFRLKLENKYFGGEERRQIIISRATKLNYAAQARRLLEDINKHIPDFISQLNKQRKRPALLLSGAASEAKPEPKVHKEGKRQKNYDGDAAADANNDDDNNNDDNNNDDNDVGNNNNNNNDNSNSNNDDNDGDNNDNKNNNDNDDNKNDDNDGDNNNDNQSEANDEKENVNPLSDENDELEKPPKLQKACD